MDRRVGLGLYRGSSHASVQRSGGATMVTSTMPPAGMTPASKTVNGREASACHRRVSTPYAGASPQFTSWRRITATSCDLTFQTSTPTPCVTYPSTSHFTWPRCHHCNHQLTNTEATDTTAATKATHVCQFMTTSHHMEKGESIMTYSKVNYHPTSASYSNELAEEAS